MMKEDVEKKSEESICLQLKNSYHVMSGGNLHISVCGRGRGYISEWCEQHHSSGLDHCVAQIDARSIDFSHFPSP